MRLSRAVPGSMLLLFFPWGIACDAPSEADGLAAFTAALPAGDLLILSMPDPGESATAKNRALQPAAGSASEDPLPAFFDVTVQAMERVNQDLAFVLQPLGEALAVAAPVRMDDDVAVWQGVPEGSDEEHLLEVRRMPGGYFETRLASRSIATADAPWRPRLSGTYTAEAQDGQGQGSMWADLDGDREAATSGTVLVLWSSLGGERQVAVFGYGLVDGSGSAAPRDSSSRFHERIDRSGEFVFSGSVILTAGNGDETLAEDALIVSRWNSKSDGRSDVLVVGRSAEADGFEEELASQCWKTRGKVTTYDAVEGRKKGPDKDDPKVHVVVKKQGRVDDCPFLEPSEALLPSRPPVPPKPQLPLTAS